MRLITVVLLAAALQGQPTFRSGVDLIRIDASIIDKSGQPVRTLQPDDFVVTVDGAPRRVVFAKFYGSDAGTAATAAADATRTFGTNRGAAPGRVVIFVVDLESMNAGHERVLLDTAGSLIDKLSPSDAVGLLPIPGKGVEITRERARAREALKGLRGASPKTFQRHLISMREARAFEVRDGRVIGEVVERECRPYETECPGELRNESQQLLTEAHRRIQNVLTTLATLNERLKSIQAPKTVVLLSAGLPFDQESISYFRDLQRRTAESGTTTQVVQFAQPDTDASSQRMAGTGSLPASDLNQGLSMVAGMSGGTLFAGIGKAAGVFNRIEAEISNSWQLGVESTAQDADGKTHQIRVTMRPQGLTVHARSELILPAAPARPTAVDLLSQPVDLMELPIAATAFSARGEDATTLKEIILVEVAGPLSDEAAPTYALAVMKDERPVFQAADQMTVSADRQARVVMATQLAPGRYRLRVAVTDATGRPGTLDLPLSVGLRQGGALQFSDLFVGTTSSRFTPAVEVPAGTPLTALLELYSADPAAFTGVAGELEIRRAGQDALLAHAPAPVGATELPGRRIATGTIPTAGLDPGSYTVSAIVTANGQPSGKVSRTIVLAR